MIFALINTMAPVIICTAIGFAWYRLGYEFNQQFVTRAVMNIGAPCLIVSVLNKDRIPLNEFGLVALASGVIIVLCALVAIPFARRSDSDPLAIVSPVAFSNCGNMGLPICLFAFGNEGLTLALPFFLMSMLINMGIGIPLFARTDEGPVKTAQKLLKLPVIHAVLICLVLLVGDIHLPVWAAHTVDLLAGITIPLMLITLGVSLASIKNRVWLPSIGYSGLRFGSGLAISVLATWALGISGLAQKVVILQSIMPAAVFNYLFAVHYNRSPEMTAGIVITSSLMAFILLPIALSFML